MRNNINSTGAVIVAFNPDVQFLLNLCLSLINQVDYVILVDNGSAHFDLQSNKIKNLHIIRLKKNVGIASAQNYGIQKLIELNIQYVIFFDQDSIVPGCLINILLNNFIDYSKHGKVAAVGPVFYDYRFLFYYPHVVLNRFGVRRKITLKPEDQVANVGFIMSSGMLTSTKVLLDVGFMKDELFIDYVDTEWCFRAISKGYEIYAIPSASMEHAVGDDNIHFLYWRLPVHSALRRYYRMRNMFYLFKLPYVPVVLKLREFIVNNIHQLIIVIQSDNRRSYLYCWFKALSDGVKILIGHRL